MKGMYSEPFISVEESVGFDRDKYAGIIEDIRSIYCLELRIRKRIQKGGSRNIENEVDVQTINYLLGKVQPFFNDLVSANAIGLLPEGLYNRMVNVYADLARRGYIKKSEAAYYQVFNALEKAKRA